jgi:hypothetical protein
VTYLTTSIAERHLLEGLSFSQTRDETWIVTRDVREASVFVSRCSLLGSCITPHVSRRETGKRLECAFRLVCDEVHQERRVGGFEWV